MNPVNINDFMDRFHDVERRFALFDETVNGEPWWDSVRFDTCLFLFDCLSGLSNSSAHVAPPRSRKLGILRRAIYRQILFAKALIDHKDLVAIRTPRSIVNGRLHDLALDPLIDLFPSRTLVVDTLPRRYHVPDFNASAWPGSVPSSLGDTILTLLDSFGIDRGQAAMLDALIRRGRGQYESQVAGYHHLFAKVRPRAVLLVQNGIEKALFHVATVRGVPSIEAQHGFIGHGHPAYSYPQGVDYSRQTGMPSLFLTFSKFWQTNGYYPAGRSEVVGTDHFAAGFGPVRQSMGAIMVIAANIYHNDLLDLTRQIAARLPNRQIIYKLHPNQKADEPEIETALSDLPNVTVGSAQIPAAHMMDAVSHLVAVQSTVVYEALQNGRSICIVPRHDYHIHSDVFTLPAVSVPTTTDEFVAALSRPSLSEGNPTFFEPFDPKRAHDLLAPLLDRPRGEAARP